MRLARRLAVALLIGVATLAATVPTLAATASPLAATASTPAQAKQPLRLQFHRVVTGVDGHCGHAVVTSGTYVLVSLSAPVSQGCPTRFLLIDDATGQRRVLRPGGFSYVLAFGAPWILFFHDLRFELYDVSTGKWRPLVCGAGCMPEETIAYAIGARWLEFIVEGHQRCSDGIHFACGPDTYAYYNLRTRKVRHGSPQSSSRIVDLDSPTLVRRLCKPLEVPSGGSLLLEGHFAVVTEQNGTSFLERCGSHLRMPIGMQQESVANGRVGANDRVVLWAVLEPDGVWTGRIQGVSLPGLHRFSATVPARIATFGATAALGAERLYITEPDGTLWAAPLSP